MPNKGSVACGRPLIPLAAMHIVNKTNWKNVTLLIFVIDKFSFFQILPIGSFYWLEGKTGDGYRTWLDLIYFPCSPSYSGHYPLPVKIEIEPVICFEIFGRCLLIAAWIRDHLEKPNTELPETDATQSRQFIIWLFSRRPDETKQVIQIACLIKHMTLTESNQ